MRTNQVLNMNNNEKLRAFMESNDLKAAQVAKLLYISLEGVRNWLKPKYTPCPNWVMPFLNCLKKSKEI